MPVFVPLSLFQKKFLESLSTDFLSKYFASQTTSHKLGIIGLRFPKIRYLPRKHPIFRNPHPLLPPQNVKAIGMNINSLFLTLAKFWFASPGDFWAKNTPFCCFFLMFVQNSMMYVFIVGFYGAEFKFAGPNTQNFIAHPFLESGSRPLGTFMVKNAPEYPF